MTTSNNKKKKADMIRTFQVHQSTLKRGDQWTLQTVTNPGGKKRKNQHWVKINNW